MENEELFEFMGKIYSEMQQGFKSVNTKIDGLENRMDSFDNRMDGLEGEVKKNSIKLEDIEKNVNTIVEVQQSHMKQNENNHIEMVKMFNDKLDFTQSAVNNLNRVK
mgnify:CR=1 FL=1